LLLNTGHREVEDLKREGAQWIGGEGKECPWQDKLVVQCRNKPYIGQNSAIKFYVSNLIKQK